MIFNIDSTLKHSYSNDDTCFSIDVNDEILEEDFDSFLEEGSKILHSIEGTLLEEEIFSKLDEFMAMTADENSESDTEEPHFKKITINTDYKIKTTFEEPPTDLELKPLPDNLEYVSLEEPSFLPVIISSKLSAQNKSKLVSVLTKHKEAFAWKTTYIPAGSESRPPMLNKENYVPWSSRLLRYAKSRPNGKLIHSIINGPYVKRMIPEPEADDQAIQTILLGLPEDIYVAVDSCETAQEIWLRVQQMMKGFDIGIQEKKAKLLTNRKGLLPMKGN
uniref:Reverse transcriptase domain-containing protein n=1 Tax=Tanacetum cinerariifolium TaxID=118510 RepID=A0A6L2KJY1_TANCI|nr:reverse transcriptase domain-containing protein [Tanacetum cinerariifolium]